MPELPPQLEPATAAGQAGEMPLAESADDERKRRHRPGTGATSGEKHPIVTGSSLLAPNRPDDHNTIVLATWVELKLLTDNGKPLVGERCQLFRPDGKIVEGKTNKEGIVRFSHFPLLPQSDWSKDDMQRPAVVFPDILEEWPSSKKAPDDKWQDLATTDNPIGEFGKNGGKRDDYRKRDGRVHFIPVRTAAFEVYIEDLTDEEKYQHFRHAYEDHQAVYMSASPRVFNSKATHWEWGGGSKCNQHVNFFLGYWYNYNSEFTTAGSTTVMACLPLYDSNVHVFGHPPKPTPAPIPDEPGHAPDPHERHHEKHHEAADHRVHHRGYSEFLEAVTGFGTKVRQDGTIPDPADYGDADKQIEYIRIAKYFDEKGKPRPNASFARGERTAEDLIAELADFNVYSVANITPKHRPEALKEIQAWMAHGMRGAPQEPWSQLWSLDERSAEDRRLIENLFKHLDRDHHCGVLMKRAVGGGPREYSDPIELHTFSADGSNAQPELIHQKPFDRVVAADFHFLHLGIWRLKPLRLGGWDPRVAVASMEISLENPPRFVRFTAPRSAPPAGARPPGLEAQAGPVAGPPINPGPAKPTPTAVSQLEKK